MIFKGFRLLMFAALVWGNSALATLSEGVNESEAKELQTISSWTAHLNFYYPSLCLKLTPGSDLTDPTIRHKTLEELKTLEYLLQETPSELSVKPLKHLSCSRAVCGGDGGGKCTTCS